MKAAVLSKKGDFRLGDWPTPKPAPGEILIRVRECGICGSDVPRILGDEAHFFPIVLGHEFSGEVAELGEGVTSFAVGDRVVTTFLPRCGECAACATDGRLPCERGSASNGAGELLGGRGLRDAAARERAAGGGGGGEAGEDGDEGRTLRRREARCARQPAADRTFA